MAVLGAAVSVQVVLLAMLNRLVATPVLIPAARQPIRFVLQPIIAIVIAVLVKQKAGLAIPATPILAAELAMPIIIFAANI